MPSLVPCPHLPDIGDSRLPAAALSVFREGSRGGDFYLQALRCAQSRWLENLPAQALLMLNRAFTAHLSLPTDSTLLAVNPLPYRAVGWILKNGETGGFLGNPRRHYQHLASRMRGPDIALRQARAWACWHLAKTINPAWDADLVQIEREHLAEPTFDQIASTLTAHALPGEIEEWRAALC